MQNNQLPFPKGWYTAGHGMLWNCDSTYCFVPYENLPLLEMEIFQGDFQWLMNSADEFEEVLSDQAQKELLENLNILINITKRHNLKLPDAFVKFMATPLLRNRIFSCTDCYFDLSNRLIESPQRGGYLIRFLNDSQNVLHWYLYLNSNGDYCVAAAKPEFLDDLEDEDLDDEDSANQTLDDVIIPRNIYCCAPDFETFIYRFWIENSIWYALAYKEPLTKEQQKYIDERRI